MFAFRETCDLGPGSPRVEVAFTDGSLDLQWRADKADGFATSLAAVEAACGVTFARLHQVHGDEVVEITEAWQPGNQEDVPVADALITDRPGIGLMIRVADCVPVVLADPATGVIGAAHAGRQGVQGGVVTRTVERLLSLGARLDSLRAWIGPHVCGRCYEVPEAMRAEVAAAVPETHARTRQGTPAVDLGAGVHAQLVGAGIHRDHIASLERCTLEDAALHSYRREGERSGRLAGMVWVR